MKSLLRHLCLLCALACAPCGATEPVEFGLFGTIHLGRPPGEVKRTVIFVSDENGWDARSESLAEALAADGARVFGVDLPAYLKAMLSIADPCSFPAGHFEEMDHWMQRREKVEKFAYPLLIGDGAGASFAYAVDAQAPKGTFAGLVTLGWDFAFALPKPVCRGDSGEITRADTSGRFRIAPVAALPNPWLPLPFAAGARRDGTLAAFGAWRSGPAPAPGGELTQAVAHFAASLHHEKPLPSDIADLPLEEVPAQGEFAQRIAIVLTGDGGWAGLDIAVADQLAKRGIAVVALNSLKYFWHTRKPEEAADAVTRLIGHYGAARPQADFVVVGYSFGASLAPVVVNRLPEAARARVKALVMISPDPEAFFEVHVGDWFGTTHHDGTLPLAPEIAATTVPVLCVHGADEGPDSFCAKQRGQPHVIDIELPGGHHYDGDYDGLGKAIATRLPPRADAP